MNLYRAEYENGLIVEVRSKEKLENVRVPFNEGLRSIAFIKVLY